MRRRSSLRTPAHILLQMRDLLRSRADSSISFLPDIEAHTTHRQRCYIEWLCDNDLHALREYVLTTSDPDTRVKPLTRLPSSLTWRVQRRDVHILCSRGQRLVLFSPMILTSSAFYDEDDGDYYLELELSPLALQGVHGLHQLTNFVWPTHGTSPLEIVIASTISVDANLVLPDAASGPPNTDISWDDLRDGDYLLVELSVARVLSPNHTWDIQYSLHAATRLATTP